jgi:hypothetical protein
VRFGCPSRETEGKWVSVEQLRAGNEVLTPEGQWRGIRRIERVSGKFTVYNFEVADNHDYFVGKKGVLVHNADYGNEKLPRFDGQKPNYVVNPQHVAPNLAPGKTPLPDDAAEVYRTAIPDDPVNPRHWYGKNANGHIYRFSNSGDGTVHFSGIDSVGKGIRSITRYAKMRLGRLP